METENKTGQYLTSLRRKRPLAIDEIEQEALRHHIPIMERDGLEAMLQFLRVHQPERILEIGTAVGYSAICMLHAAPQASVFTIERDEQRADEAVENACKAGVSSRFHLIRGDALQVARTAEEHGPFDALFIDAAKGQYDDFFNTYGPMVKKGGLIFSDNVLFKGLVANESQPESGGLMNMVKKIRLFNEKIMADSRYSSTLLPVGDGLMISIKTDNEESNKGGK